MPIKDWSTYIEALHIVLEQHDKKSTDLALYVRVVETTDPRTDMYKIAEEKMKARGLYVAHLLCMADALIQLIPPELLDLQSFDGIREEILRNVRPADTVELVVSTNN